VSRPIEAHSSTASPRASLRRRWEALRDGAKAVARLRAYDVSTEEGRSLERYRRAALSSATNLIAKLLSVLTGMVSVPLTIGYLGRERYGLWMAASALQMWMQLADFGMARSLQNRLSTAYGRDDDDAAARYVTTALFALGGLALVFGSVFAIALPVTPWARVLNVTEPALAAEATPTVAALGFCFLAAFPLSVARTVLQAYQRAYVANLFWMAGNVLSLIALYAATRARLGLPWLVLATGGANVLWQAGALAWVLRTTPALRPALRKMDRDALRALGTLSAPMFLFQVGGILIAEMPTFVIAHAAGLAVVGDYAVWNRVYALGVAVIGVLDAPVVPALREAHARGDHAWVREAFRNVQRLKVALAVVCSIVYVLGGNAIARFLSAGAVGFEWPVWVATGVQLTVAVWNMSYVDVLIALDRVWTVVGIVLVNGLVSMPLIYFAARPFGVLGAVTALVAFSVVVLMWALPLTVRDVLGAPPRKRA
jgi:O-antigen/teichoic acid export membrane protein